MIAVYIDNKNVTEYIVSNDFGITISIESEVELLAYTDNFTLTFTDNIDDLFDNIGGQYFELYYENELIIVGNIIKVSENVKEETIDLEFGTIDYLYSQSTFSTNKNRKDVIGLLSDCKNGITKNLPNLRLKDDEAKTFGASDFGAYYTYSIDEIATKEELKNYLDIGETDGWEVYTGFFQKVDENDLLVTNDAILTKAGGSYNLSIYKDNYIFGRIAVQENAWIIGLGGAIPDPNIYIKGKLYNIKNGNIDFDNSIDIAIERSRSKYSYSIYGRNNELIITEGIIKSYDSTDTDYSINIYKYYHGNYGWDNNSKQEDEMRDVVGFLEKEIQSRYFTKDEVDNDEAPTNILSLVYNVTNIYKDTDDISKSLFESTLFTTVEIENDKYLFSIYLGEDDIFHYYYDNEQFSNMLSDFATISDNYLIFKGNKLIVVDRNGLGYIEIDEKYIIEKDTTTQYIVVDYTRVDDLSSGGGYSNGIVILDLSWPFNVMERIKYYYKQLQNDEKQVTRITALSNGFDTFDLIGKRINDYGVIQEITYKDETVEIRAEKRL